MDIGLISVLIAIGLHYVFLMFVFKDYDNKIKDLQNKVAELDNLPNTARH